MLSNPYRSSRKPLHFGAGHAVRLTIVCIALYGAAAQAQAYKGRWQATSNTAISITGDVTIDAQKIAFAGARKPMVLDTQLVEARPGRWLFAVTGSKTGAIPLINGNFLCGRGQLPTYIIATVERNALMLAVSIEPKTPSLNWTGYVPPNVCATYNFSK